ncbi:hypothetical protein CL614_08325 [archaeon]|nr:hypothetical protein [archaeon]|tara:strand:- start:415 stop:606 length:192 start_codon:yes stop_codon:yes gene_type:complete
MNNLGSIIKEKGLRKNWVANRMNVSSSLVTKWIKGDRRITPPYREKLARLLGVPADIIWSDDV